MLINNGSREFTPLNRLLPEPISAQVPASPGQPYCPRQRLNPYASPPLPDLRPDCSPDRSPDRPPDRPNAPRRLEIRPAPSLPRRTDRSPQSRRRTGYGGRGRTGRQTVLDRPARHARSRLLRPPVTPASLFQAASLTKQLTAHAAHALRASGKLDFDRPLVSYLDDLPHPTARTVTLRHVLSHSSGFPNWRFTERGKPAPALEPAFPPGSKFQYSGEGYFYLQRILEEVTGQGFGQLLAELVMKPAGMTDSTLVWDPATLHRTALPHNRRGEPRQNWDKSARALRDYAAKLGKPVEHLRYADYAAFTRDSGNPPLPNWMLPNAASSLITSANDYARFLAWSLKTPGLDQPVIQMNDSLSWGLGWGIERIPTTKGARTFLWQWGDNGGYKNFVLAEPAEGDALFVFTNGDSGARLYERVLTRATGMEHPAFFWL
ncbi:MAG: serine hydrolase [Bryobacterales bacterium]|nr:serine hydrolase [Bryobacterales bacterium]